MSYKSELQSVIKMYKRNLEGTIQQINQARDSGSYTPQGLSSFVESINETFSSTADQNRESALKIIRKAEDAFKSENQRIVVGNLNDGGFQMGLLNAVNALKHNEVSEEDFKCIVEAFKEDSFAINRIKEALKESKNGAAYAGMLPYTYEDQIKLFGKLKTNTVKYIRPVTVGNNSGAQMGIQWLLDSIETLRDDLLLPSDRIA